MDRNGENTIKSKHITAAFLCVVLFAVCGIALFLHWVFFLPAVLALAAYVAIDKKYLRCPDCHGFSNLDRLFYAKRHPYHCSHCGKHIEIE